ncbi:LysR family transcriptional regulator [Edwardsiella tarda]|uniref:LysR family transcriptional regulator n=1 Tax=Edwardsiella tarda TaxID=636 RepID=UPI00063BF3B5|nr:LysR family transcriptional regulator [Edwardsiella tarda]AKH89443.1 LysR family transcriptional regulator [Edwardsiella tarda]
MDVKWLEDFLSLYRLGNFSAAAKARNVTQPAFSRRIRALEIWLGVPLFDRSSNPIALTPYGEKFLPSAEDILARIHDVKFDFAQLAVQSDETVRIVSLHTFAVNVLPALLDALGEALAGINVVVNPGLQGVDNHFNTLLENSADLLMVYDIDGARPNAVEREGLQAHLLAHETLIPVISRNLAARQEATQPLPYLAYSDFSFIGRVVAPLCRQAPRALAKCYETSMSEGLKHMVLRDRGLAWLPLSMIHQELAQGVICNAFPDHPQLSCCLPILLYKRRESCRPAVERFWQAATACCLP